MTAAPPSDRMQAYLKQALQMNPVWESTEILELRRTVLGKKRLDTVSVVSFAQTASIRDAIRKQIAVIQGDFWKLPMEQLRARLDALDVSAVPELVPVINRLKTTAACRGEFPKLAQLPGMDTNLFNAFKSIVVLPPSEAGYIRDRFLNSIRSKDRLKTVQNATRLIEKQYPILYLMERDWFANILKAKRATAKSEGSVQYSDDSEGSYWPRFIIIMIVIKVLFAALRMGGH